MAGETKPKVTDQEIAARAKMAAFIDHVIDVIQSNPQEEPAKPTSEENPARVARSF